MEEVTEETELRSIDSLVDIPTEPEIDLDQYEKPPNRPDSDGETGSTSSIPDRFVELVE